MDECTETLTWEGSYPDSCEADTNLSDTCSNNLLFWTIK